MPNAALRPPTTVTIRLLRLLLAASLVGPAVLFVGTAWQERRVLLDEAARRAESSVEVLEQHATAALRAYELIFARVEEHVRSAPDENEAQRHAYLAAVDDELKETESLFLTDAAGRATAHSRFYPVGSIVLADRDYFRDLAPPQTSATPLIRGARFAREHPSSVSKTAHALEVKGLAVGAPNVGRFSGTLKLNIARSLTTSDGQFAGIVAISVAQEYFEAFHRQLAASRADSMVLARADGVLLARSPALGTEDLQQVLDPGNRRALLDRLTGGTTTFTSSLDGIERIAAFRKLAAYPIYVGYGLGTQAVLNAWHAHVLAYGTAAMLAALTLFGVTWLALRSAQEEVQARAHLIDEMGRREIAEQALRQSQKMEAVGQLTGGIAHDFNNLLAAVLGNLELLAKRLPDEPRLRRYVDGAMEGARRGAGLTQRMLAFARRQELKLEAVDVVALVHGMEDLLVRSLGSTIDVETCLPAQLAPALVDANQLEAALLNLAVNARDAMSKGGRIIIAGREEGSGNGPFGLAAGRYVVLSVRDTGEGMSADTLARAAEPFFTTKPVGKGTGLGLAMVHGLAAQSGGTLRIESVPGRGTCVELWLPHADGDAPANACSAQAEPALLSARACCVLLVDDDPLVLKGTAAMLEDLGHTVVETGSAHQALALLRAGAAFDLVITDQIMPSMTGVEMVAEIARMNPRLPVLLVSGFAALSEAEAGRVPRLAKPFTQSALTKAIAELVTADKENGTKRRTVPLSASERH